MFKKRTTDEERYKQEAFHSFLRAELCKEVRQAVKIVQKESAELQKENPSGDFAVTDTESTRELINLIEACFIHGINRKFRKVRRIQGKEKHEINIWGVFETVTSKSDINTLKTGNKLLKTKTGLARAAIRHFLNSQVLDCYLQALLLDNQTMVKYYEPWALLRDPDHAEVFKCSLQGIGNLKFSFNTNAPMLDTWGQNTLELAAIIAPKANHSSQTSIAKLAHKKGSRSISDIDALSENSSFVSESTNISMMSDFTDADGVQVLRKKMKRRRRREAKRSGANFSTYSGPSTGASPSSFNDSLSAITEPSEDASCNTGNSSNTNIARLDELDELQPDENWSDQRPEADQNIAGEVDSMPDEPALRVTTPEEATSKFARITFTELLSSTEGESDSLAALRKQLLTSQESRDENFIVEEPHDETPLEKEEEQEIRIIENNGSDTESQGQYKEMRHNGSLGEENSPPLPVENMPSPTQPEAPVVGSNIEHNLTTPAKSSEEIHPESVNQNHIRVATPTKAERSFRIV